MGTRWAGDPGPPRGEHLGLGPSIARGFWAQQGAEQSGGAQRLGTPSEEQAIPLLAGCRDVAAASGVAALSLVLTALGREHGLSVRGGEREGAHQMLATIFSKSSH